MNDIRKFLDIISESSSGGTSAGGIAVVANPQASKSPFEGAMTRVKEENEPDLTSPQVESKPDAERPKLEVGILEYGNWENSSLVANKKLKQRRDDSHRGEVVRDVYDEEVEESSKSKVVKSVYGEQPKKDKKKPVQESDEVAATNNVGANTILLFAYGLSTNDEIMKISYPSAKKIGTGDVAGFSLKFQGKQGVINAMSSTDKNAVISGVVWKISRTDLAKMMSAKKMDGTEAEPASSEQVEVVMKNRGDSIKAVMLKIKDETAESRPSPQYLRRLGAGYAQNGIDSQQIEQAMSGRKQNGIKQSANQSPVTVDNQPSKRSQQQPQQ